MAQRIHDREALLRSLVSPLPGATPRENLRPIHVPASHDGETLGNLLTGIFPQISKEEWEERCAAGRFTTRDGKPVDWNHRVRAGEQIMQKFPMASEPPVANDVRILHEDEACLVVLKPAPLPMHAAGRFHHNTLRHFLNLAYAPECPRPLHRLDANTTGLVLFARTRHFCHLLQRQFLENTVKKSYLARIGGHPPEDTFRVDLPIAESAGPLGGRRIDETNGLPAQTDFTVLRRSEDGTCLLRADLHTGRTNQIRLHLQHLGWPVCGDPAYLADGRTGETQTLAPGDPPLQLHAWRLAFHHPLTGARMTFEAPPPAWASGLTESPC